MLLRNEAGLTPHIIAAGPPFGIAYTRTDLENRTAQQGEEKVLNAQRHDVRNRREYPDETESDTKQFPC